MFRTLFQAPQHRQARPSLAKACCSAFKAWRVRHVIKELIWLEPLLQPSRESRHSTKIDASLCWLLMTKTPIGRSTSAANACTVITCCRRENRSSIMQTVNYSSLGDYDIRVEQAEFSEISVVASGETGATVSIISYRTGAKVTCEST